MLPKPTTVVYEPPSAMGGDGDEGGALRPARWRRAALAVLASAFVLMWAGGVATHWAGGAASRERGWLASPFLILAGLIVVLSARTRRGVATLAALALYGFAVEILGARTGFPFGAYAYTDALWPRLCGVPVVMGFAWMVLVAHGWSVFARMRWPAPLAVVAAALWTTAVDLVIDPLAANELGYWRWPRAGFYYGIAFTNFAGWFMTSLVAYVLFRRRLEASFGARAVGFAIVLFFTAVALAHSLAVAALVGFALCAIQLALAFSARGDGDGFARPKDSTRQSSHRQVKRGADHVQYVRSSER